MMYLNDFSVRVPGGTETNGYVELPHGRQYSLVLRNARRDVRCDAEVEIDGQHVGTWRIEANSHIRLERPAHDDGRFTFYAAGTKEAQQVNLNEGSSDLGLIKVTFTPEIKMPRTLSSAAWENNIRWSYLPYPSSAEYGQVSSNFFTSTGDAPEQTRTCSLASAGGTVSSAGQTKSADRSGGTGLSGVSGQIFNQTYPLNYDYAQRTTIHLRLILRDERQNPRPLTQNSNPVPPRI